MLSSKEMKLRRVPKFGLIFCLSLALTSPALAVSVTSPIPQADVNKFVRRFQNADLPKDSGVTFIDLANGQTLHQHLGDKPFVPASTMKIVTAAVALKTFGPRFRFSTEATWNSFSKNLYLVGSGDPALETSHLEVLADGIATSLGNSVNSFSLYTDSTLFPKFVKPEGWNPNPMPRYVRDIYSLSVDGRGSYDSPKFAGQILAKLLKARGYKVNYLGAKKSDGAQIATTFGKPLQSTLKKMLRDSENTYAETLFRASAAHSGLNPTWKNSREYAYNVLQTLNVDLENIEIIDGSGLSRSNRLTAHFLTSLLLEAVDPENPELNVIYESNLLATAGRNGTLKLRFSQSKTMCARGLVHAKTGSLSDTDALAGFVKNENGSVGIFAFLVNHDRNWYVGNKVRQKMDWIISSATGCN